MFSHPCGSVLPFAYKASCPSSPSCHASHHQFVNHVFNSQQLSNKALLVDHLAFQHHIIQHQSHGSFLPEPNADSLCLTPNGDRINGCGDLVEKIDIDSTVDPEAFFPRCFNMEGGAVSALVDAFVVSASVALLRKSLEAEVGPLQKKNVVHPSLPPEGTVEVFPIQTALWYCTPL